MLVFGNFKFFSWWDLLDPCVFAIFFIFSPVLSTTFGCFLGFFVSTKKSDKSDARTNRCKIFIVFSYFENILHYELKSILFFSMCCFGFLHKTKILFQLLTFNCTKIHWSLIIINTTNNVFSHFYQDYSQAQVLYSLQLELIGEREQYKYQSAIYFIGEKIVLVFNVGGGFHLSHYFCHLDLFNLEISKAGDICQYQS